MKRPELVLLLAAGALLILPGLYDADVFKTACLALLLPLLLLAGARSAGAWFSSAGARLYVAATAVAAGGSLLVLERAGVVDRLLLFALANGAALLGAQRKGSLSVAMLCAAVPVALLALAQALGWERSLTPGPEEIVATLGNSTRAGALLALALPAAGALVLRADRRRLLAWCALLALLALALMLTKGRGARLGACAGLLVVLLGNLGRWKACVLSIAAGVLISFLIAGKDVLPAAKLASPELTTQVRLSLWRASGHMIAAGPLTGYGLGRFAERFPPFREPEEAALPGLGGAATYAEHPHNELLLGFVEGGWIGGSLLLAFFVSTLFVARRALFRNPDVDELAAIGAVVAGSVIAQLQDAWVSPGTALVFFAAAGWLWAKPVAHETGKIAASVACMLLMICCFLLAWPRLSVQLGLRRFMLAAQVRGVAATFPMLRTAADADPTDVDAQRIFAHYAEVLGDPSLALAKARLDELSR